MPLLLLLAAFGIGVAVAAFLMLLLSPGTRFLVWDCWWPTPPSELSGLVITQGEILTPLRGRVFYTVARPKAQIPRPETEEFLADAIIKIERFMGEPFPVKNVVLRFDDRRRDGEHFTGVFNRYPGTLIPYLASVNKKAAARFYRIDVLPEIEQDPPELKRVIAHEIAHYYWHHHQTPHRVEIDEYAARYLEYEFGGNPKPYKTLIYEMCLQVFENPIAPADFEINEQQRNTCPAYLRAGLFFAAEEILGAKQFKASLRELWDLTQSHGTLNQEDVLRIFVHHAQEPQFSQLGRIFLISFL